MFFRLSFVTLIFALLTLGTQVKRNITKIESDMENINKGLQALNSSIDALSTDPTLEKILVRIHQDAVATQGPLQTATDDVTASSPFTEQQINIILELLEKIIPFVKIILDELVDKKSVFVTYEVTPIVLNDLKNLQNDTAMFGAALIEMSPAANKTYEKNQMTDVDAAFTFAINEFAN